MPESGNSFEDIQETLKRSAAALKEEDIPFMLGGSLACWARGGPESTNDLDLFVKPADAKRALSVLVGAGMRAERPPEDWLLKAWDGEVLVDLIFAPLSLTVDDDLMQQAECMSVFSIDMPVMRLEDVLATKLMSLNDHYLDYSAPLQMARAVREQVDWHEVTQRTADSPYARAFVALLAELEIVTPRDAPAQRPNVRVVPG
jgi:putative nucleotidyltransferase-like protein